MFRTSSTGDADKALRDDDTAAKEYSPSSGRRVAHDDRQEGLFPAVRILTRGCGKESETSSARSAG